MSDLINTIVDQASFKAAVAAVEARPNYQRPQAFAIGLAHIKESGVLSVRFPHINLGENFGAAAIFYEVATNGSDVNRIKAYLAEAQMQLLNIAFTPYEDGGNHPNISALKAVNTMFRRTKLFYGRVQPMIVFIHDLLSAPTSTADAYLRLHLLSSNKVQPGTVNLNGTLRFLTDCVWTAEEGPIEAEKFDKISMDYMIAHGRSLTVHSVHRLPRMTDFVVPPPGVRIGDADDYRLGTCIKPDGGIYIPWFHKNGNSPRATSSVGEFEKLLKAPHKGAFYFSSRHLRILSKKSHCHPGDSAEFVPFVDPLGIFIIFKARA